MSSENQKRILYEQFARVGKTLSSGSRIELLEYLAQGEKSVEALAEVAGLSVANTSQHLQLMRHAGFVTARKKGQKVYYSLSGDMIIDLMATVRKVAEKKVAEAEQIINSYFRQKDTMEPVPAKELLKRVKQGLVTILDVRPADEYQAGHIPEAINVPLKELEKKIKHLDSGREIVAYCRGPYCVLAYEAVELLRKKGFKARRLEDGFPEWKTAGLPVARG